MYKLVAIDLDGTLLDSHKEISEKNVEVIGRTMEKGIKVVICSGRIYAGAKIYAKRLQLTDPIISCNGAVIKDMAKEEILFSDSMSSEDCCKIIDICKKADIYFHVYGDDTMYIEKLAFSSLAYRKMNESLPAEDKIKIEMVKDLKAVFLDGSIIPSKVVVISDDHKLLSETRNLVGQVHGVDIMSSHYNNFEVMNRGVNKGKALQYLTERLGIKRDEVIAIGDNENDYSMIQFAGLGIAMENADDRIKAIADQITSSNDDDGVAEVLIKLLF